MRGGGRGGRRDGGAGGEPGRTRDRDEDLRAPERRSKFEVVVAASVDDVWNTRLRRREGLSTWLWRDTSVDLRKGGSVTGLRSSPAAPPAGTITSITPKRQLVIAAMAPDKFPTVRKERIDRALRVRRRHAEIDAGDAHANRLEDRPRMGRGV